MKKKLRIYVDTSAIGGCFDEEFQEASNRLIGLGRAGGIIFLVSDVVVRELEQAPEMVRNLLSSLPENSIERIYSDNEAFDLRDAYLDAGILGPK